MNKFDKFIYSLGMVAAFAGWLWTLGIVLDNRTPSYMKQAGFLLLIGSFIVVYYDKVKNKKE